MPETMKNKRSWTFFIRLAGIGIVMTACTSPATLVPTPTAITAPTPTALPPTREATASPVPEVTLTPTPQPAATLSELVKTVDARLVDSVVWASANEGQQIFVGGSVRTGAEGAVRIDLTDGSIVRLASASNFELATLPTGPDDPIARLTLLGGKIFIALGALLPGSAVEVETPIGSASVRGSVMGIVYVPESGEVVIGCLEGHCTVSNDAGTQELTDKQQSALAAPDQPPDPPQPLSAELLNDFSRIPEAQTALTTGDVIIPFIPCFADNTCDTYCTPPSGSTQAPPECTAVQEALLAQGVNFDAFRVCVTAGGDPQQCANDNRRQP